MNKLATIIDNLKDLRKQAVSLQNETNAKRANNDTLQFLEDSLRISNINDGMVIIIMKDMVIKEKAPNGLSHRKVAQEIFDSLPVKHIDLSKTNGDFGDDIAREYDCIFIRLVSILNGTSIIYLPDKCNEFQINELEKFNHILKEFNNNQKDINKASVAFMLSDGNENDNLDLLIEELKNKNSTRIK